MHAVSSAPTFVCRAATTYAFGLKVGGRSETGSGTSRRIVLCAGREGLFSQAGGRPTGAIGARPSAAVITAVRGDTIGRPAAGLASFLSIGPEGRPSEGPSAGR